MDIWNKLPEEVVEARTITKYKTHWAGTRIEKSWTDKMGQSALTNHQLINLSPISLQDLQLEKLL